MGLKSLNYFRYRNNLFSKSHDRASLGSREMETLRLALGADETYLHGKSLVDLGCGDGFLRQAVEAGGGRYIGIDAEDCDLEHERIPIEDGSCDFVVCLALIEHLVGPLHLFDEVKRVLKPGGTVWLSTPDIQACKEKFWDDPTHVHPYTRKSLETALRLSGFDNITITPNFRMKPSYWYTGASFWFFVARHLLFFSGTTSLPIPRLFSGRCAGLFAFARFGGKKDLPCG